MKKIVLILLIVTTFVIVWAKPLPVMIDGLPKIEIPSNTILADFLRANELTIKAAMIVGTDSIAVGVTADEFDKIHLKMERKKWNVESDSLPSPVKITNVSAIYLYNPSVKVDPNQISFEQLRNSADFQGQAEKNGYIIWKYRVHKGVIK